MMKMLLFNRPDANQGNLRSAAYEALMELIKNSAKVSRIVKKKKIHVERGFMTLDGKGSIITTELSLFLLLLHFFLLWNHIW